MIGQNEMNLKEMQNNVGDDLLKKIEELEEKSKNTHDVEKLAKQI